MLPSPPSLVTLAASSQKRTSFFGQKERVKCQGQCHSLLATEDIREDLSSSFSDVSSSFSTLLKLLCPLFFLLRIFGLYDQSFCSSWKSFLLSPGFLYTILIASTLTLNFAFTAFEVALEKKWIDLQWFSTDSSMPSSLIGHRNYNADLTILLLRLQVVFNVWFCFFMCRKTYLPSLSLSYDHTHKDTGTIQTSRRWIYGLTTESLLTILLLSIVPFLLPCCDANLNDLTNIFTGSSSSSEAVSQTPYSEGISYSGPDSSYDPSFLTNSATFLTTTPPYISTPSSTWSAFPTILFAILDIFSAAAFILPLLLFKSFCILSICNFQNLREQFQKVLHKNTNFTSTQSRSLTLPEDIPCDLSMKEDDTDSDKESTWLQQDQEAAESSSIQIDRTLDSVDRDGTEFSLKTILARHRQTTIFTVEVKNLFNSYINFSFVVSTCVIILLAHSSTPSSICNVTTITAFFYSFITLLVTSAILQYKAHAPCFDLCEFKKIDEENGDLSSQIQVSFFLHRLHIKPVGFSVLALCHLTPTASILICCALLFYLGHLTAQSLYGI